MAEYLKGEIRQSSLTVLMPFFGGTENIQNSYDAVIRALSIAEITDYELFILTVANNDRGNDSTPAIVTNIIRDNPQVRH